MQRPLGMIEIWCIGSVYMWIPEINDSQRRIADSLDH